MVSGADEPSYPASLNVRAVVAFVAAAGLGMVTLFALPTLRSTGLTFREAFLIVGVVEFGAAVVAGAAAMNFYTGPD
ncbi:hypothetical protein DU504_04430 [Haloplanus salinus]|jgi:hypothetical protein|uniref:Uncharacterized protein n=1 Tax=Haloplanus salinus TaxID=1126245 RepID=A0A368N7Q8_9EURY|nr:hypothetical protein [Haloplanus salinus]RCU46617.1 hypothetical protein DU504_04430 [Haloplanus salinus]